MTEQKIAQSFIDKLIALKYLYRPDITGPVAVDAGLGATIKSINSNQFAKYKFVVPKSPEQQKIDDCLTWLGQMIASQSQKLNALKPYKEGLMQQLFLSPQEVEG
jgi:hypothetical protein